MIYIGIDPGLHGAVAVIEELPIEWGADAILIKDTPILVVDNKNKSDMSGMAEVLRPYFERPEKSTVIMESVHSMPKQGVASSFTFGEGFGIWKGIIAAFQLPLELVSPQRWKKAMLADQGKEKDASRFKAMQLFPSVADQLKRVKDDGRAEALLLAEYGRRLRKG